MEEEEEEHAQETLLKLNRSLSRSPEDSEASIGLAAIVCAAVRSPAPAEPSTALAASAASVSERSRVKEEEKEGEVGPKTRDMRETPLRRGIGMTSLSLSLYGSPSEFEASSLDLPDSGAL